MYTIRRKIRHYLHAPGKHYVQNIHGYGYRLENVKGASIEQTAKTAKQETPPEDKQSPESSFIVEWDQPAPPASPWDTLTKREYQVFLMLGDSQNFRKTTQELAEDLKMAQGTFKTHLKRIYSKLGITEEPKRRKTIKLARRALAGHKLVVKEVTA